MGINGAKG